MDQYGTSSCSVQGRTAKHLHVLWREIQIDGARRLWTSMNSEGVLCTPAAARQSPCHNSWWLNEQVSAVDCQLLEKKQHNQVQNAFVQFYLVLKVAAVGLQHCLQPWLEGLTTWNNEISAHGSPLTLNSLLERFHIGLETGAGLPLHFTSYCKVQWWEIRWRWGPHSPWPEVYKMLLAPMLDQLTSVHRCWILLPHVPTIWVCGIQPRFHHCLQDIDIALSVDFEALGEPVRRHLFPIICDYT